MPPVATAEPVNKEPQAANGAVTTPTPPISTIGSDSTKSVDAAAVEEFDPDAIEEAFGLPSGSLKDVTDTATALDLVRQLTDKTLIAGLELGDQVVEPAAAPKAPAAAPASPEPGAKTTPVNAEIEALRAQLVEVKTLIQQQTETNNQRLAAELDGRIRSEIDSWESPKYGVGKSRNFNQTKAEKELRNLARTHVAGLQVQGAVVPTVEVILRRVRAFDDADFKPTRKSAAAPLGTPGTPKGAPGGGKDEPKNIHELLMRQSV